MEFPHPGPPEPHNPLLLPADGRRGREKMKAGGKKTRLLGKQTLVLLVGTLPLTLSLTLACRKHFKQNLLRCFSVTLFSTLMLHNWMFVSWGLSLKTNDKLLFFISFIFIANTYTKDSLKTVQIHGKIAEKSIRNITSLILREKEMELAEQKEKTVPLWTIKTKKQKKKPKQKNRNCKNLVT